jgi:hypothetical protein
MLFEPRRPIFYSLPAAANTLYDKLNEVTPDDATYVSTTELSTFKVALSPVTDPGVDTGHALLFRAKKTGTGRGIRVRLLQGTTVIDTWELK